MPDREIWLLEKVERGYRGRPCESEEELQSGDLIAVTVGKDEFEEKPLSQFPLFRVEEPDEQDSLRHQIIRPIKLGEAKPLDPLLALLQLKPTNDLHDLYFQLQYATVEELLALCETFDTA